MTHAQEPTKPVLVVATCKVRCGTRFAAACTRGTTLPEGPERPPYSRCHPRAPYSTPPQQRAAEGKRLPEPTPSPHAVVGPNRGRPHAAAPRHPARRRRSVRKR